MKNLFPENSLHHYKKGKSKMIKPLGIFRFQVVLSAYYTIPKINRELQRVAFYNLLQRYYTIPKINRELQRVKGAKHRAADYTIPKINRELQQYTMQYVFDMNYTIPKINRELQPFIRCQGGKEGLNFDLKKNVFLGEQILKKVLTNSF